MAQAHKEIEKLRLQVKKLAQKDKGSQEAASQEDEEDPEELEKSKVSEELRVARKKLAWYRNCPVEASDVERKYIAELEDEIQGLQEKVRAGQPFDQRKAGIERQLKNAKESLKKEQHTVVMQDKSLAEVQEKRDRAAGLVLTHEAAIASLEADLKEVHAKEAGGAVPKAECLDPELDSMLDDPQMRDKFRQFFIGELGPRGEEAFSQKFPRAEAGVASNPSVGEVVAPKPPEISVGMEIDFESFYNLSVASGLVPEDADKGKVKEKFDENAKKRKTEAAAK
jgi:hypothetical protein